MSFSLILFYRVLRNANCPRENCRKDNYVRVRLAAENQSR